MNEFRVGQPVVCVDPADTDTWGRQELQKDAIYRIRWVGMYSDLFLPVPELCVRLCEFPNRTDPFWPVGDVPFRASRFRPVVEGKTDAGVAMLKKLLDPSPLEPVVRTNLEAVK